jgi:ribokinase
MKPLLINPHKLQFQALIGTGGIGSGMFFALDGNQTLGREESRSGRFLNQRDYCKLHIITHYLKILLGKEFQVILVSKVGNDDVGQRLLDEMLETGLDIRFVQIDQNHPTMLSLCFLYPDGSGCNLTAANSACGQLNADYVKMAEPAFEQYSGCGLALAVPEVPLLARKMLLEQAKKYNFFTAASFTSGEILFALEKDMLSLVDLLSINLDEAATLLPPNEIDENYEAIVDAAFNKLRKINPKLSVTITAGKRGSWCMDGEKVQTIPALPVQEVSTAGAGDAFFAGFLCGVTAGLSFHLAQELGTLVASCSITSPHTIHPTLDRVLLSSFVHEIHPHLSKQVRDLVESENG